MSDLGRLFRARGVSGIEPLENFTTAALAIAINHDDRPMKAALFAVDEEGRATGVTARRLLSPDIVAIKAEPQRWLSPEDGPLGYLDLVLSGA